MELSVADELEIRNIVARVAWLTDSWKSPEEYVAEYTPDASWHLGPDTVYEGHEGLKNRIREMLDQRICGPGLKTRHCVTSMEVVPGAAYDGNGHFARSFWIMYSTNDAGQVSPAYGEYHDSFRFHDGRWRVSRRVIAVMGGF